MSDPNDEKWYTYPEEEQDERRVPDTSLKLLVLGMVVALFLGMIVLTTTPAVFIVIIVVLLAVLKSVRNRQRSDTWPRSAIIVAVMGLALLIALLLSLYVMQ